MLQHQQLFDVCVEGAHLVGDLVAVGRPHQSQVGQLLIDQHGRLLAVGRDAHELARDVVAGRARRGDRRLRSVEEVFAVARPGRGLKEAWIIEQWAGLARAQPVATDAASAPFPHTSPTISQQLSGDPKTS